MAVHEILNEKLRLRDSDEDSPWRLWETKSLNMHRGVLHWRPTQPVVSCADLALAVRQKVTASYRRAWWRGFAFGVLVEVFDLPPDVRLIESCIDTRENSQGTWQWLILACPGAMTAIGVHTWVEGYLATTYRALLSHYEAVDYCTDSFQKEQDRLLQFLTAVAGRKGSRFRQFEPWAPKDG